MADVEIMTGQLEVILKRFGMEEREISGIRALRLDHLEALLKDRRKDGKGTDD